jgi:pyridoxal phosphate enzyme (YggS family)
MTLPQSEMRALEQRLDTVRDAVAEAATKVGRDPAEITIIGVSKTVGRELVEAAYQLGLRHFGENRVQDETTKFAFPRPDDLTLHHIGYLQSNKARAVLKVAHVIHSVDRESIIEALDREAEKLAARGELVAGERVPVFLQVNVAREPQKAGCAPEEVPELLERLLAAPRLDPVGLMTMAPLTANSEETRPVFAGLRELRDRLTSAYPEARLQMLSMGMSNDYPVAVEEGATHVRIGRAIFGG